MVLQVRGFGARLKPLRILSFQGLLYDLGSKHVLLIPSKPVLHENVVDDTAFGLCEVRHSHGHG